jgi:eukaryotic-like serine/threonine-protein kinase
LVRIAIPGGRYQHVQVLGIATMPTGGSGLLLASPCAPADPDRYAAMLRVNATLSLGAVELRTLDGSDFFVLSASLPVTGLSVYELRQALRAIAERADKLEESLTGDDVR